MQIINDPGGISRVSHPGIGRVLSQRMSQLQLSRKETLSDIGRFVIVEPQDTITDIEKASGCYITTDMFGEADYGDPDFTPSFEWLEHHTDEQCYELAYIMTDDFFTAVFVPDDPGIDPRLIAFCREYS